MISPSFVDHLVFRVTRLDRTEQFYTALLGQSPDKAEDSLMYRVGDSRLFFTPCVHHDKLYDKESIGLNHIAFGVRTLDDLQAIKAQLDSSGISHSGIGLDRYGLKEYIWLDDPEGMRIEFYLRSQ